MLTNIALIVTSALLASALFKRLGAPGIVGMIAAGVALGPSGLDWIRPEIRQLLQQFKTVALMVILIRAGLGINRDTLNKVGGPAVRMGFIPGVCEGAVVALAGALVLGLPFHEAGMLGFIIAAVSPAIVVPQMLELKERGLGKRQEVPTLVLAGASLDDVLAITLFGVFVSLAEGGGAEWWRVAVSVPAGVALGAGLGLALGGLLVALFRRVAMRDTVQVLVFLLVSAVFLEAAEHPSVKEWLPVAALLGIMAIGFVILERSEGLAKRLAAQFNQIWVLAELLLFVYIGSELRLEALELRLVGGGLLIIALGLLGRSAGVALALWGSALGRRERLFCMIAYVPKATVQAAIGAVPLGLVLSGRLEQTSQQDAQTLLAMAVLSIVVTAPAGALAIRRAAPALLD